VKLISSLCRTFFTSSRLRLSSARKKIVLLLVALIMENHIFDFCTQTFLPIAHSLFGIFFCF